MSELIIQSDDPLTDESMIAYLESDGNKLTKREKRKASILVSKLREVDEQF